MLRAFHFFNSDRQAWYCDALARERQRQTNKYLTLVVMEDALVVQNRY
jgi:hypothetical protein